MNKYTEEMTAELVKAYTSATTPEECDEVVKHYAELWAENNINEKSIIAKLSKAGVYKAKKRVSKVLKGPPQTKESMVHEMEKTMGLEFDDLYGLEKAPKLVLLKIKERICNESS